MAEHAPGWTPYRFGFNNPIMYTDALGLFETKDEAKKYAEENGIKTGLFRRNKINKNTDAAGNTTYSIDNRKERSSTMSFDDGDGGRVVVVGAMVLDKDGSGGSKVMAGITTGLLTTQADSPFPGPADAVGAAIVAGSVAYGAYKLLEGMAPLPTPDFTLPTLTSTPGPTTVPMKPADSGRTADQWARDWGYDSAHDLKDAHGVGSDYDIYRDGKTGKGVLRRKRGHTGVDIPIE